MDINRLNLGQRIAAGAGILLFIDLFLGWYSGDTSNTASGWESFSWIDIVCAAAAIVAVLAALQAMGMIQVPANINMVLLPLAAVATILVLFRLIDQPFPVPNKFVNNEFGAYLGFALAALMTYGSLIAGDSQAGAPATAAPAAAAPPPPPPPAATPPPAAPPAAPPADPPAAPPPTDPPAV